MARNKIPLPQRIDNMSKYTFTGILLLVIGGLGGFWSLVYRWGINIYLLFIGCLFVGIILIAFGTFYHNNKVIRRKK